jgi:hypothetical protein
VLGAKRSAATMVDVEEISARNSALREHNDHLRQKLRRIMLEAAGGAPTPAVRAVQASPQARPPLGRPETSPSPRRGPEESNINVIASGPSAATPAAPSSQIGVAHLLMFLSIVLRLTGRMPQALAEEMAACLGSSHSASTPVVASGHPRVMTSWRLILSQHCLDSSQIATVRRRLVQMTESTEADARVGRGFRLTGALQAA